MSNYASPAAYAASKALAAQDLSVQRSHLIEVIAALLGYRTYAALATEEADTNRTYYLEDAEILVLNKVMGEERVTELGLNSMVIIACIDAIKACAKGVSVYVGVSDLYDSHARQALAEVIYSDDDVAGAMAESNASYTNEPYMADECLPTADLWAAIDEWIIEADGVMEGEYDPEGDRIYNGHVMNCRGRLVYGKAGRAGLVFLDARGSAGADDSWRDEDLDEAGYWLL
ncbi:hypothetical protein ACNFCK_03925 [Pseudomonas sp. NY15366]